MVWAFVNDLAQRGVTWNKRDQRANLARLLRIAGVAPGDRGLDFGCGTGLFTPSLLSAGVRHVGYDIDERLVRYARRLYPTVVYTTAKQEVVSHGPYQLVVANCCFHHIDDASLDDELAFICKNLQPGGRFILIDILAPDGRESVARRWYNLLERGAFRRRHEHYVELLATRCDVIHEEVAPSHVFSSRRIPLYTNLGMVIGLVR